MHPARNAIFGLVAPSTRRISFERYVMCGSGGRSGRTERAKGIPGDWCAGARRQGAPKASGKGRADSGQSAARCAEAGTAPRKQGKQSESQTRRRRQCGSISCPQPLHRRAEAPAKRQPRTCNRPKRAGAWRGASAAQTSNSLKRSSSSRAHSKRGRHKPPSFAVARRAPLHAPASVTRA